MTVFFEFFAHTSTRGIQNGGEESGNGNPFYFRIDIVSQFGISGVTGGVAGVYKCKEEGEERLVSTGTVGLVGGTRGIPNGGERIGEEKLVFEMDFLFGVSGVTGGVAGI